MRESVDDRERGGGKKARRWRIWERDRREEEEKERGGEKREQGWFVMYAESERERGADRRERGMSGWEGALGKILLKDFLMSYTLSLT